MQLSASPVGAMPMLQELEALDYGLRDTGDRTLTTSNLDKMLILHLYHDEIPSISGYNSRHILTLRFNGAV